jgi:hypothetical protein
MTGINNTAACKKNEIQTEITYKRLVFLTFGPHPNPLRREVCGHTDEQT